MDGLLQVLLVAFASHIFVDAIMIKKQYFMVYLCVIQSCWRLYESLFSGMLAHHFVDIQVTSFDIIVNFNFEYLILVV